MKKVIFIQRELYDYRKPLYEKLNKFFDLTLIYSGSRYNENKFKSINIKTSFFLGFIVQNISKKLLTKKTIIIIESNLRLTLFWILLFKSLFLNAKVIFWGMGPSNNILINFIKKLIVMLPLKQIFYNEHNLQNLLLPFLNNKSNYHYVINNTVYIPKHNFKSNANLKKFTFIHVGSLNERKKQIDVFRVIKKLKIKYNNIRYLLIGSGPKRNKFLSFIKNNNLNSNIKIINETSSHLILKKYYDESLATICFGQAGLTVCQSLGYSTPVILHIKAISGGEKYNIIDNYNGYLIKSLNELYARMETLILSKKISNKLSENSIRYYNKNLSFELFVNQFIKCINSI